MSTIQLADKLDNGYSHFNARAGRPRTDTQ